MPKSKGIYKRNPAILERLERTKLFHGMGLTTKEMASIFDISTSTVLNYLQELGLKANRRNETAGHRSVMTLELCERCKFKDCIWNGVSPVCPMEFMERG